MKILKSPVGILTIIAVLVIVLATVIFIKSGDDSNTKSEPMGQAYEVQGAQHIEPGTEHPAYNSNPPTSGSHYPQAAQRDFYDRALQDEQLVHNLEHGEIWMSYKGIDDNTKRELAAIYSRNRGSVIVTAREANERPICLASWGRLMCMDSLDVETVNDFIKANKNNSPEPLAR